MPSHPPSPRSSSSSFSTSSTTTPKPPREHKTLREHKNARAPKTSLSLLLWRPMVWFESTFALSMLEDWEKVLLMTIFGLLFILVGQGILNYLPQHILDMRSRALYYLFGSSAQASSQQAVLGDWQAWVPKGVQGIWGGDVTGMTTTAAAAAGTVTGVVRGEL